MNEIREEKIEFTFWQNRIIDLILWAGPVILLISLLFLFGWKLQIFTEFCGVRTNLLATIIFWIGVVFSLPQIIAISFTIYPFISWMYGKISWIEQKAPVILQRIPLPNLAKVPFEKDTAVDKANVIVMRLVIFVAFFIVILAVLLKD